MAQVRGERMDDSQSGEEVSMIWAMKHSERTTERIFFIPWKKHSSIMLHLAMDTKCVLFSTMFSTETARLEWNRLVERGWRLRHGELLPPWCNWNKSDPLMTEFMSTGTSFPKTEDERMGLISP